MSSPIKNDGTRRDKRQKKLPNNLNFIRLKLKLPDHLSHSCQELTQRHSSASSFSIHVESLLVHATAHAATLWALHMGAHAHAIHLGRDLAHRRYWIHAGHGHPLSADGWDQHRRQADGDQHDLEHDEVVRAKVKTVFLKLLWVMAPLKLSELSTAILRLENNLFILILHHRTCGSIFVGIGFRNPRGLGLPQSHPLFNLT